MKKVRTLIALGSLLENKYAESQTLQQIIENAASYGEKSANGIMNFPAQLKQDQATLSITVTIDSGMLGGLSVEVSPPTVEPAQFAPKYAKLPEQIKKYLDKHASSFQLTPGTNTLRFGTNPASPEIASY